jgi:hypothetical protein
LATVEPLLRVGADHKIVTTAPLCEVVTALERVASGASNRDPLRSRRGHQT